MTVKSVRKHALVFIISSVVLLAAAALSEKPHNAVDSNRKAVDSNRKSVTVDVTDFGAVPNDGKDDTQPIRDAMAELPAGGGSLYFPAGTYLTDPLTLTGGVRLIGNHTVLKAKSVSYSMLYLKGNHIRIEGLTIDGNNQAVRGVTIAAGSSAIELRNSTIRNFRQPADTRNPLHRMTPIGIRIEGNTSDITIDGCHIMNVYAIHKDKYWNHKVARGVLISPENKSQSVSKNVTVRNCRIYGVGPKDDGDGIVIQGWNEEANLFILNNTFDKNHKRAIKIQTPGATIQGNRIHNPFNGNNHYDTYPGGDEYDMYAAISVYGDNVSVKNNTIDGVGSYSAAIDIAGANDVVVSGNTISNGAQAKLDAADLIRVTSLETLSNITIKDNTLENGRLGIHLIAGIDRLTVRNNKMRNIIGRK